MLVSDDGYRESWASLNPSPIMVSIAVLTLPGCGVPEAAYYCSESEVCTQVKPVGILLDDTSLNASSTAHFRAGSAIFGSRERIRSWATARSRL
jgi:hypothetical protein